MTSVARKIHMPSRAASFCCSISANWWAKKLREEGQVETDEDDKRRGAGPHLGITPAGDFRPPKMQAAQVRHDRAADHDVMEVGHDKIRVGHVHIDRQRGEYEPGQAAN